jgi:hypothetical protein
MEEKDHIIEEFESNYTRSMATQKYDVAFAWCQYYVTKENSHVIKPCAEAALQNMCKTGHISKPIPIPYGYSYDNIVDACVRNGCHKMSHKSSLRVKSTDISLRYNPATSSNAIRFKTSGWGKFLHLIFGVLAPLWFFFVTVGCTVSAFYKVYYDYQSEGYLSVFGGFQDHMDFTWLILAAISLCLAIFLLIFVWKKTYASTRRLKLLVGKSIIDNWGR